MTGTEQPEATLANWQDPPHNRWSFLHLDQVVATRRVHRGEKVAAARSTDLGLDPAEIESLRLVRASGAVDTVAGVVRDTETDGMLVLHDGAVVYEHYGPSMSADQPHLLMSVTKSFVGAVAATLLDTGMLERETRVADVVPETRGTGYGDTTVGDLLDMRSGVRFSEAYLDPESDVRRMEHAVEWRPRVPGMPGSLYDFLVTLVADRPHGGVFHYRSAETNMIGWVCERAAGAPMQELLSGLVWSRLGAEHDAIFSVDPLGTAIHDGGLAATLRDVARFGQALLDDGRSPAGEQVLPAWWVRDTLDGGHDSKSAFAHSPSLTGMPGGHYRNQIWVPYPDREVLLCLGIHGQMVLVDRVARTVGVKLSSWPVPLDPGRHLDTVAAFHAITDHLTGGDSAPTNTTNPKIDTEEHR
ncbi:serine hydrolase domain-containing protein [Nocardioides ungokensis]|uniref:serine hydrolase domain-containing protein n=1 Tax=Nocardioides ungokensis TaxID=1643322 RepID=UPI0015E00839|nr:serine hydrolase [Nocardioides ungokensis]